MSALLFLGVAAAWVGVPIVGGAVLAAAGVLAEGGKLNVWWVIVVATVAAWTGGYAGYRLGAWAGETLLGRPGRWQCERRQALAAGARFYQRWGPIAVFLTPTWVSGAMRMPRRAFLMWNAFAALASTLVTVFGAYAIASAVLGRLAGGPWIAALGAGLLATAVAATWLWRSRGWRRGGERWRLTGRQDGGSAPFRCRPRSSRLGSPHNQGGSMAPSSTRTKRQRTLRTVRQRPWPVDPDLSRRVVETRQRIAATRREVARHILPERPRERAR